MRFYPSQSSSCPCLGCSGFIGYGRFEYDGEGGDFPDEYGSAENADHGISENGWPADKDPKKIGIVTITVPLKNGSKKMQVAAKAANALEAMVKWWDATIEPVTELGSYNYRDIRGSTTTISNHASGTAVDINQAKHKLGDVGTVTEQQAAMISAKAASLGLRWGGNYRHRKDEMHVEMAPNKAIALASAIAGRVQDAVTKPAGAGGGLLLLALGGAGFWYYRRSRASSR